MVCAPLSLKAVALGLCSPFLAARKSVERVGDTLEPGKSDVVTNVEMRAHH